MFQGVNSLTTASLRVRPSTWQSRRAGMRPMGEQDRVAGVEVGLVALHKHAFFFTGLSGMRRNSPASHAAYVRGAALISVGADLPRDRRAVLVASARRGFR